MGKRILIDGTALVRTHTGVAQYTINLFRELVKLDRTNQYIFYIMKLGRLRPEPITAPNVSYRYIPLPIKAYSLLHRVLRLPVPVDLLSRTKTDLAIFPNFVRFPLFFKSPSLIIIYDLSYLELPQYAPERNRRFLEHFLPRSIEQAGAIVTISRDARTQISQHYPSAAAKLRVVTCAVDPKHYYQRKEPEIAAVKRRYRLPDQYILFVSTLEPRKNVVSLIEGYRALPPELKQRYGLVLVGGQGWKSQATMVAVEEARAAGETVVRPGYVEDAELPALYSGASLFAFPSHYEGFGIPPLEAMACGVPVVTSNTSSLPEVVGEAAITIDPTDTAALTAAMLRVLKDPQLAARLREKGLKQAKKFSWKDSAQAFLKVIEELT